MTVRCSVSTDEEPDYIELDFAKDRRGFRYSRPTSISHRVNVRRFLQRQRRSCPVPSNRVCGMRTTRSGR